MIQVLEQEEKCRQASVPSFSIRDCSVHYGDKPAVNRVSMDIPSRQVTAFIGPSGCGKSSLLRCFNRMNDLIPNCRVEGSIKHAGLEINQAKLDVVGLRTNVGMVFQQPNPFPFSIFENVAYGLRCQGIRDKDLIYNRVETALRQAALWSEVKSDLNHSALSLSGGQKQRLCIARAIALKPEIILMDEPTSALDPVATAKIEELIVELKHEYSIIIVTHSMSQAARISDQTAFFLLGTLVEYGPTAELFNCPEDSRTEAYINGKFG